MLTEFSYLLTVGFTLKIGGDCITTLNYLRTCKNNEPFNFSIFQIQFINFTYVDIFFLFQDERLIGTLIIRWRHVFLSIKKYSHGRLYKIVSSMLLNCEYLKCWLLCVMYKKINYLFFLLSGCPKQIFG